MRSYADPTARRRSVADERTTVPVDTAEGGQLSSWRICSGSTRLMDAHPILNGSPKDIEVYDCKASELDAIARDTGLADRAAIRARQVGLVVEAKHIDRNAGRVARVPQLIGFLVRVPG